MLLTIFDKNTNCSLISSWHMTSIMQKIDSLPSPTSPDKAYALTA